MIRKFQRLSGFFVALFVCVTSLDSHAVCKTCQIRSSHEDSPAFCDDLHTNVCKKIEKESTVLGNTKNDLVNPPVGLTKILKPESFGGRAPKGSLSTDSATNDYLSQVVEPGYRKFIAEHGEKDYRGFAKKVLGLEYKINSVEGVEKTWERFFTEAVNDQDYRLLFPEYGSCDKVIEGFDKTLIKSGKNLAVMKSLRPQLLAFREKSREEMIKHYAKNVRAYYETYVSTMCKDKDKLAQLDEEDRARCKTTGLLRKEIIELTALDVSEQERLRTAQDLVKRWMFLPEDWKQKFEPNPKKNGTDLEDINNRLYYASLEACKYVNEAFRFGLSQNENDLYYNRFLPSKAFVEHTFDTFITPKRQDVVKKLGDVVREDFREKIAAMRCAPQDQIKKALVDLKEIQVSPFKRPKDSDYEKNSYGEMVLKKPAWGEEVSPEYDTFGIGNPRLMAETNGYFTAKKDGRPAQIQICGDLYLNAEASPEDAKYWLAHEFGHWMDSENAANHYPGVIACYKSLHNCLAKKAKDQLRDDQMAESISDAFAAEYIAGELEKIPKESRRSELEKYLKTMCRFERESSDKISNFSKDPHTDQIVRLNYLIGGNRRLREALSCSLESKNIPVCELNLGGEKP